MAESLLAPAYDWHLCHANTGSIQNATHTDTRSILVMLMSVWLLKVCMVFASAFAPLNSIRSRMLTLLRWATLRFTKRQQRNWLIRNVWTERLWEIIAFPCFSPLFFLCCDLLSPTPHKHTNVPPISHSYSSLEWKVFDNVSKWLEWSRSNYKAPLIVL